MLEWLFSWHLTAWQHITWSLVAPTLAALKENYCWPCRITLFKFMINKAVCVMLFASRFALAGLVSVHYLTSFSCVFMPPPLPAIFKHLSSLVRLLKCYWFEKCSEDCILLPTLSFSSYFSYCRLQINLACCCFCKCHTKIKDFQGWVHSKLFINFGSTRLIKYPRAELYLGGPLSMKPCSFMSKTIHVSSGKLPNCSTTLRNHFQRSLQDILAPLTRKLLKVSGVTFHLNATAEWTVEGRQTTQTHKMTAAEHRCYFLEHKLTSSPWKMGLNLELLA